MIKICSMTRQAITILKFNLTIEMLMAPSPSEPSRPACRPNDDASEILIIIMSVIIRTNEWRRTNKQFRCRLGPQHTCLVGSRRHRRSHSLTKTENHGVSSNLIVVHGSGQLAAANLNLNHPNPILFSARATVFNIIPDIAQLGGLIAPPNNNSLLNRSI